MLKSSISYGPNLAQKGFWICSHYLETYDFDDKCTRSFARPNTLPKKEVKTSAIFYGISQTTRSKIVSNVYITNLALNQNKPGKAFIQSN